nr:MAG TPA: hypothetical protein [Caudoviricetes sp.]
MYLKKGDKIDRFEYGINLKRSFRLMGCAGRHTPHQIKPTIGIYAGRMP